MSWIVGLITLVLLVIESVISILFLMLALNGIMSLPNAFVTFFLVFTGGTLLGLSVLSGFVAQKLVAATSLPSWLAAIVTIMVSLIVFPIALFVFTFLLLLGFGLI